MMQEIPDMLPRCWLELMQEMLALLPQWEREIMQEIPVLLPQEQSLLHPMGQKIHLYPLRQQGNIQ